MNYHRYIVGGKHAKYEVDKYCSIKREECGENIAHMEKVFF